MAVIEKAASKVGFYNENGKLLREVKVGSFPRERCCRRRPALRQREPIREKGNRVERKSGINT